MVLLSLWFVVALVVTCFLVARGAKSGILDPLSDPIQYTLCVTLAMVVLSLTWPVILTGFLMLLGVGLVVKDLR